ncbi:hypothetical protein [Candidatus Uabimicrobium sp. HlEnr_7]|uniref:hypothetical protein n=1 Tax=Candidatus Uabimicrobium helgolandensis TaxID=3095367 RepID=UPI0035588086
MMKRLIGGILLGLIIGIATVALVEYIGHLVYPVPTDLDLNNKEQMKEYVKNLPFGAFLFVLLAWATGVGFGSFVATKVNKNKMISGITVGIFFLLATIINLIIIPHPTWFLLCGLSVFPIFSFLGAKVADSNCSKTKL